MDKLFQGQGTEILGLSAMDRQQQVWNLRQAMYAKAGVISSPSFLRMERTLDSTTSVINFDLTDSNGSGPRRPTEKRLKQGNTFTVLGAVMFLSTSVIREGNESTDEDLMLQQLYANPNPVAFGASAPNLMALYNGIHSLTIDSTVFIESISTRDFYRVGTAQQGYGVGGAGNAQYAYDSWNFEQWGSKEIIPSLEISGGADVNPQIKLGTSIDLSSQDPNVQNNIVLYYFGYENVGAKTVFDDWLKKLKDTVPQEDIPSLPVFKSIR